MEDNEDLNVNPKFKSELHEVQTNIAELTEDPNPNSEDLKSTNSIDTNKGKPRYINPIILNYTIYLIVHLSYWNCLKTLDA